MKLLRWISLLSICGILLVGIIGSFDVFGVWIYSQAMSEDIALDIKVQVVPWEGYEQLPDTNVGENHIALIERIVNSNVGLNNSSSFLNEYIEDRINDDKDNAASVAPTPGGNLKDLFNTAEIRLLDFMIHIHFDNNGGVSFYEVYTFETALVGSSAGKNVSPIYKTILSYENGRWTPSQTIVGSATTMRYDAKQGGGKNITVDPASFVQSSK